MSCNPDGKAGARLQPVLWDNGPRDNRPCGAPCRRPCLGIAPGRFPSRSLKFLDAKKIGSNKETSMFVNVNAHPGNRSNGELGELSRAKAILSEFKYKKGTEVY